MALTILDDSMSSDRTVHTARRVPGHGEQQWEVSWLPGRSMDRNDAITAMTLAEAAGVGGMHAGHRLWPHVESWAKELGLTAPVALAQAATPPGRANEDKSAEATDPEAAG